MVSWRSWLARLLNTSDSGSLGITEEVAGSNPAEITFWLFFGPIMNMLIMLSKA